MIASFACSQHPRWDRDFGNSSFLPDDGLQMPQNRYRGLLSEITTRFCRAYQRQPNSKNQSSRCPVTLMPTRFSHCADNRLQPRIGPETEAIFTVPDLNGSPDITQEKTIWRP
uniref:Uncharacterized protein n=1 Tax=Candidatus Kentrum sp. LPFa TaxID=2126335 RepID=A0A450Y0W3_9GAMM|nr:MAG: hypothetical protein BECKLPF1236A_GA0070988_103364 [Candidatus Kentron sp. LPFa]VFK35156.1 MAG: hypothetical protein BECKLPF1236C_GA0070990_103394 [Candidatus Kentron sp. LPFa]